MNIKGITEKINIKSIKDNLPSVLFCAFTGLMMLAFFISPRADYSESEKRVLETFPEFSLNSLGGGSFGKSFEKYISDHFTGRKFFIGLNSYYDLYSGRNGLSGIYKGKDGYLLNKPVVPDNASLNKNIKKIRNLCEGLDVPSYMITVPSTGYIMNEKLPYNHTYYHDSEMFSLIKNEIGEHLKYVDIEESFKSNKDMEVFYKTDHHWSTSGAYIAYLEYCRCAGMPPVNSSDMDKSRYNGFYGTCYSRSALWFSAPDVLDIWKAPESDIEVYIDDGSEGSKSSSSMFFDEHLDRADKYPVFLDGNHSFVKVVNKALDHGRLLMIKDSFAHSMIPFLSQNYSEIYMIDPRYYKSSITDSAKESGIDTVLVVYGIDNIVNDSNIVWIR